MIGRVALRAALLAARLAGLLAVLSAVAGCGAGSSVPEPAYGPHTSGDPVSVPFPPPPARPDVIGSPPTEAKDPVWIDGQWLWRGRKWVWQGGQWWERPPEQVYASPAIVRLQDGELVWFEGRWRATMGLPTPGAPSESAPR